jgi:predicted RNA binding protein YcfA (HicA-like mRNA interferase family)
VKIPRNVHGRDFANHLIRRWDFREIRQTGSHIILRTEKPSGRTISVPAHKPLRPGTFRDLINDVAEHKAATAEDVLRDL